jgi:hypothetical protein
MHYAVRDLLVQAHNRGLARYPRWQRITPPASSIYCFAEKSKRINLNWILFDIFNHLGCYFLTRETSPNTGIPAPGLHHITSSKISEISFTGYRKENYDGYSSYA